MLQTDYNTACTPLCCSTIAVNNVVQLSRANGINSFIPKSINYIFHQVLTQHSFHSICWTVSCSDHLVHATDIPRCISTTLLYQALEKLPSKKIYAEVTESGCKALLTAVVAYIITYTSALMIKLYYWWTLFATTVLFKALFSWLMKTMVFS